MRAAIFIACASVLLLAVFWDGPEPRFPAGVLVPYEPDQDPVEPPRQWQFKDSQVTALATFRVRARVLLTAHYWWGNDAAVSPVDLALGWRLMSNQEILDGLHLYSLRRAYAWAPRNGSLAASEQDIIAHSANMHRSEEHTSELQSLRHLVCRLLLEKKKKNQHSQNIACHSQDMKRTRHNSSPL